MLNLKLFEKIYFYCPHVDFRKGMYGLSVIVQDEMNLDPFKKYLFLFSNSKRNKIKALYYDKNGFAMWVKYLIEDKFFWPKNYPQEVLVVENKQFNDFLNGLNPFQIPFKEKKFEIL